MVIKIVIKIVIIRTFAKIDSNCGILNKDIVCYSNHCWSLHHNLIKGKRAKV